MDAGISTDLDGFRLPSPAATQQQPVSTAEELSIGGSSAVSGGRSARPPPSSRDRRKAARRRAAGRMTSSIVAGAGVNHRACKGSASHSCPATPAAPLDDPSSWWAGEAKPQQPELRASNPLLRAPPETAGDPLHIRPSDVGLLQRRTAHFRSSEKKAIAAAATSVHCPRPEV